LAAQHLKFENIGHLFASPVISLSF
jgi:hypothetical protein